MAGEGLRNAAVNKLFEREAGMHDIGTTLTPRELEVARMIAKGMHNKAVANKLAITQVRPSSTCTTSTRSSRWMGAWG